jgi:hypothetical protein
MTLMLLEKPEIENLVVVGVACHERLIVRFMTSSPSRLKVGIWNA